MAFSQGSETFDFEDDPQLPSSSKRPASPSSSTNQGKKFKEDEDLARLTKVLLTLEDLDVPLKDLTFTVTSSSGKIVKVIKSELFAERTWDPSDSALGAIYNAIIMHFKEKYPDKVWDSIGQELAKTAEFKALMNDWEKHHKSKPKRSWEGVTPMEILYKDKDTEFMVGVKWSAGTLRFQVKKSEKDKVLMSSNVQNRNAGPLTDGTCAFHCLTRETLIVVDILNQEEFAIGVVTPKKQRHEFTDDLFKTSILKNVKFNNTALKKYIAGKGLEKVDFTIMRSWINNKQTSMGRNDTVQLAISILAAIHNQTTAGKKIHLLNDWIYTASADFQEVVKILSLNGINFTIGAQDPAVVRGISPFIAKGSFVKTPPYVYTAHDSVGGIYFGLVIEERKRITQYGASYHDTHKKSPLSHIPQQQIKPFFQAAKDEVNRLTAARNVEMMSLMSMPIANGLQLKFEDQPIKPLATKFEIYEDGWNKDTFCTIMKYVCGKQVDMTLSVLPTVKKMVTREVDEKEEIKKAEGLGSEKIEKGKKEEKKSKKAGRSKKNKVEEEGVKMAIRIEFDIPQIIWSETVEGENV